MGKAKFKKKAAKGSAALHELAPLLGGIGGAGIGYATTKATRKSQDAAGMKETARKKKDNPLLGTIGGGLAGGAIGSFFRDTHELKGLADRINPGSSNARDFRKLINQKVLRNPLIAGAVLGGGGAALLSAHRKRKAKKQGTTFEGGPTWASGLKGALYGSTLPAAFLSGGLNAKGGLRDQMRGMADEAEEIRRRARARGSDQWGRASRSTSSRPVATPSWAEGAKTQKEVKKRFKQRARETHPDATKGPDTDFKNLNSEWSEFKNSRNFKDMTKEAAFLAFTRELQRIMEVDAS